MTLAPPPPVYPRVGGGTWLKWELTHCRYGLSPRGRGNLAEVGADALPVRSIPAWAGEPVPVPMQPHAERVYPRVGGGTGSGSLQSKPGRGLSPRGRGNRRESLVNSRDCRSIPAWAGEPAAWSWNTRLSKVYPRVGGGTAQAESEGRSMKGLSPRGRGNRLSRGWSTMR